MFDSSFTNNPGNDQFFFESIPFNSTDNPGTFGAAFTPTGLPGTTFGPFGEDEANFCWGIMSIDCGMPNPLTALASYKFVDIDTNGGRTVYSGYLTATANGVPEPASAALLVAGLAAAGLARKRKS